MANIMVKINLRVCHFNNWTIFWNKNEGIKHWKVKDESVGEFWGITFRIKKLGRFMDTDDKCFNGPFFDWFKRASKLATQIKSNWSKIGKRK